MYTHFDCWDEIYTTYLFIIYTSPSRAFLEVFWVLNCQLCEEVLSCMFYNLNSAIGYEKTANRRMVGWLHTSDTVAKRSGDASVL